jgi:hypothetical protein
MADAESRDGTYLTGRSESNGTFKRGGREANEGTNGKAAACLILWTSGSEIQLKLLG